MKYHFGFMYTENELCSGLKIVNRVLKPCSLGRVVHVYLIWREREHIVLKLRNSRGITLDNLNKGTAWNLKSLI